MITYFSNFRFLSLMKVLASIHKIIEEFNDVYFHHSKSSASRSRDRSQINRLWRKRSCSHPRQRSWLAAVCRSMRRKQPERRCGSRRRPSFHWKNENCFGHAEEPWRIARTTYLARLAAAVNSPAGSANRNIKICRKSCTFGLEKNWVLLDSKVLGAVWRYEVWRPNGVSGACEKIQEPIHPFLFEESGRKFLWGPKARSLPS